VCGIAGLVSDRVAARDVDVAVARLSHRGPDAAAVHGAGTHVLGHTRLRILDLSPEADQPMANDDGSVSVVFNGEIYNFVDLRRQLQADGHRFRTNSDTEVLVHLYEEDGEGLVERLRGMFSFAIWDEPRQRLVLGRDRLGIKPLYYRSGGGALAFASEVRALARPDDLVDPHSLGAFLHLGWVPGPRTILAGISELPAAHLLVWHEGRARLSRYWSPPPSGGSRRPPALSDLTEALTDAAHRHLVADVPVGLFLSSGVDSVAIGRLVGRANPDLRAFTVSFLDENDEAVAAAGLSRRLGLRHTVVPVDGTDVVASLPQFVSDMDQPTVDGLNSWVISRAVRAEGIVVALSGLGGDELFGGYSTFRHVPRLVRAARALSWIPEAVRSFPDAAAGRLQATAHSRARRALEALAEGGPGPSYAAVRGLFGVNELAALWPRAASMPGATPAGAGVTELELTNYLPYQLLRDTDCMSMAHALEVRVPLLDDGVVDVVLRRQASAAETWAKKDLLAAVDPGLVDVGARPKQTFTLPIDRWLRGPLKKTASTAMVDLADTGLGFEPGQLTGLWQAFGSGHAGWRQVWSLVVLSLWLDHNFGSRIDTGSTTEGGLVAGA